MASITQMETKQTSLGVQMLRTCITRQNVRILILLSKLFIAWTRWEAKKEDNPEEALKEFAAIVDQETEKGDWWVLLMYYY